MKRELKASYESHDQVYQRLKAEGSAGWGGVEAPKWWQEVVDDLDWALGPALPAPCLRLLELGCGNGGVSLLLAKRGLDCTGVDISKTAVEWAKERAFQNSLKATFLLGNVLALPFDEEFDLLVDGRLAHCIVMEDRPLFWRECLRVLKPGGTLVLNTMCNDPHSKICKEQFDSATRLLIHGSIATRYLGRAADLLVEARQAGFGVLRWKVTEGNEANGEDMLVAALTKPVLHS